MEPSGPQPPSLYWRRRALAFGAALVALVLVIWGVSAMFGGSDPSPRNAADPQVIASTSATPSASATATATTSGSGTAAPSGSASATSSATSSAQSSSPTPTPSTTAPPAPPPAACGAGAVVVAATVGEPSYQVGQHPQFAMTVVNIGKQSCTLDVGGGQRELLVQAADGTREWSNTDCLFAPRKPDVQTLRAGQQLHYGLTWAGRSSQQGCPVQRHRIPAGKYTLTARLGALTSAKTPFTLT